MDHPLRSENNASLRREIHELFRNGFSIPRQSDIVFVCGGNEEGDMRKKFQAVFDELMAGYQFFEPEFAMQTYLTLGDNVPFDIATFEEMIGELSHSIIIFPEAPGSLAETGYFSAVEAIANKVLLVLDSAHLKKDSFISIGPAQRIDAVSIFKPYIEMDYVAPDFARIAERVQGRAPLHPYRRGLTPSTFGNLTSFELFGVIQYLVSILRIATVDDIEFFLRGLFSSQISPSKVKQIVSILVGSSRLVRKGEFGHLMVCEQRDLVLKVKDGAKTTHDVLMLDISTALLEVDQDFLAILEA